MALKPDQICAIVLDCQEISKRAARLGGLGLIGGLEKDGGREGGMVWWPRAVGRVGERGWVRVWKSTYIPGLGDSSERSWSADIGRDRISDTDHSCTRLLAQVGEWVASLLAAKEGKGADPCGFFRSGNIAPWVGSIKPRNPTIHHYSCVRARKNHEEPIACFRGTCDPCDLPHHPFLSPLRDRMHHRATTFRPP